jgi:parallel beta-helix repeat protein
MTIRGTGSCAWGACSPADSEMTPRFKLSAVPYAFTAKTLTTTDSGFTTTLELATPTQNNTITAPDDSGTICLTSGNCAGVGGTGDILQGGNTFGTAAVLGTNDAFGLTLETNNTAALTVSTSQLIQFNAYNCSTFSNGGTLTTDASGNVVCANDDGGGGGTGVDTLAAIGSSPNANGATISGTTLTLQPASSSFGGVVTTGSQTFSGSKTFTGGNVTITRTNNYAFLVEDGSSFDVFVVDTSSREAIVNGNVDIAGNTTLGSSVSDSVVVNGVIQGANALVFEGATLDAFELTLAVEDPTGDQTITIPDTAGVNDEICLLVLGNCSGGTGSDEFITVAANDSSAAEKAAADYVADGTSDETEINSALTAAAGGKVVLLPGTFVADGTIYIPDDTTLSGVGKGTVIQLDSDTDNVNLIENTNQTTGVGITIRDLELNGDKAANANSHRGIYVLNLTRSTFENILIYDFDVDGVTLETSDYNTLTNITSETNGGVGIYLSASSYNNLAQIKTTGNTTASGIALQGQSNSVTNSNATGNFNGISVLSDLNTVSTSVTNNNANAGILLNTAYNNSISNNQVNYNGNYGLRVEDSSENNISGNSLYDNGGATTNYAISFNTFSDNNTIANNLISDSSCTTTCYAIDLNGASNNYNLLIGNRIRVGTIRDNATGTVYSGQTTSLDSDFQYRVGSNSATAFTVQNASGASILTVDTTNAELEVGNTTTAGRLVISDGSSNTATILVASTAGNYTYTIPTTTANDTFCLVTLNNCAGNSKFTDGGTATYLTATADELVVGSTSQVLGAKLAIVGTADQEQLLIRANATQTSPLILVQDSAGSELFRLDADNNSIFLGKNVGANDDGNNESTGIGENALAAQTSATYNVALGRAALRDVTTQGQNVALGTFALMELDGVGGSNTAVGHASMVFSTAGWNNTAIGAGSLQNNTGDNNVSLGGNTLQNKAGGNGNIAIGHSAGSNLTDGSNNIIIGPYLNFASSTGSNQLNIGGLLTSTNYTTGGQFNGTLGVTGLATFDANLRISDGSSNYGTIAVQSTSGNYTYTIPTTTANDTFCLATLGNCFGSGSGGTLQAAYNAGNTITTTDARDIDFTLANTTTDSNFDIVVATGSTGGFRIYNNATLAVSYTTANGFSVPGAGTESEQFGRGATAGGGQSVALGYLADTNTSYWGVALGAQSNVGGDSGIAIGGQASTSGSAAIAIGGQSDAAASSVALGDLAQATASYSIAIGQSAVADDQGAIVIGRDALLNGNAGSIVLGAQAQATAANQLVVGSDSWLGSYITDAYFGAGVTSANAATRDFKLNATGGSGTDIGGADFTLAGGRGTGSASGGSLLFQTSAAGASGTTLRNLSTVLTLQGGTGAATFQNTTDSISAFQIQNAAGASLFNVDSSNAILTVGGNLEVSGKISSPYGGFGDFTNLLDLVQDFDDNTYWVRTSITAPTADTIVAPNSTTTAESVATSASGGNVRQDSSTAVGSTYTFSVWLKTASGTQSADLRIDGTSSGTGTVKTVTATTAWQRFFVTQNTSGFTGNVRVRVFPGGTAGTGTVHAWGAQLNAGSTPGVYSANDDYIQGGYGTSVGPEIIFSDVDGYNTGSIYLDNYGSPSTNSGTFTFQTGGSSGVNNIAMFRDCCNAVFTVAGTGNQSEFNYGLIVNGTLDTTGNVTLGNGAGDLVTIAGTLQGTNALVFEGSSANAFETTLAVVNPTADITYQLADVAAGTYEICTTAGTAACLSTYTGGGGLSATLTDNTTNAWDIQEGTNNYININTTNGSENISFGNATTNPSYSFLGSGNITFGALLNGVALNSDIIQFQNGGGNKRIETSGNGSGSSISLEVRSGDSAGASETSGNVIFRSGDGTGTGTDSGDVYIDAGSATGTAGVVSLGSVNASALTLGRTGVTTTNAGALTVTQVLTASSTSTFTGLSTFDGNLRISDGSSNYATITVDPLAANYSIKIPTITANDEICLLVLGNCSGGTGSDEIITVAANDSSAAEKAAADYLADGTSDEDEINSALTAATGGKVILLPGTFVADGTILIPNNTTLEGSGSGTIIQLADIDATDNLIETTGTNKTGQVIKDLTLDGQDDLNTVGSQQGIYLLSVGDDATSRQGATIINVTIFDFSSQGIAMNATDNTVIKNSNFYGNNQGIRTEGAFGYNNVIESNLITNNDDDGIQAVGVNYTIIDNTAEDNGGNGIYLNTISESTVSSNTVNNNASRGLYLYNFDDSTATANTALNNGGGGIEYFGVGSTISSNSVSGNTSEGIYLVSTTNSTVIGNTVTSNTSEGIFLNSADNNIIENNIVGSNSYGIRLSSADTNIVSGNNISTNGGTSTNRGVYLVSSDYNTISNNIISDTSCDSSCYAIDIFDSGSDKNYLEGNRYWDTDVDAGDDASINNTGTNTIFVNQQTNTVTSQAYDVSDFRFRGSANSTTAFSVQNAAGSSIFTVDTTNGGVTILNSASTNELYFSGDNETNIESEGSIRLKVDADNDGGLSAVYFNDAAGNQYGAFDEDGTLTVGGTWDDGEIRVVEGGGTSDYVALTATSVSASYTLNLPTAVGSTSQCLQTDSVTATQLVFGACGGGGGSLFTDGGSQTYLTATTDELVIGGSASVGAKLAVIGDADEEQLLIRANSSQSVTNPLVLFQNSAGTEISRITISGTRNQAFGQNSLNALTTGTDNTGFGYQALQSATDSVENTAFGSGALDVVATGSNWNVAVGSDAGGGITSGDGNTALGASALMQNTSWNTAIGRSALQYTTGGDNVAVGATAGVGVNGSSTFANSVLLGSGAGSALTTGGNNILLGYQAGNNLTSGANNIIIGYDLDASALGVSNELNIGNVLRGDTSNGSALFRNTSNTATAFQVQNASGNNLINVNTTSTSNLVTNGSFETDTTGWSAKTGATLSRITTHQADGNASMQIATAASANSGAQFNYALAASTTYTFYARVKLDSGSMATMELGYSNTGTDVSCSAANSVGTEWTYFSCVFTTAGSVSGTRYVYIKQTDASARNILIDRVQLTATGIEQAYNNGGTIQLLTTISSPLTIQTTQNDPEALSIYGNGGDTYFGFNSQIGTLTIADDDGYIALGENYSGQYGFLVASGTNDAFKVEQSGSSMDILTVNASSGSESVSVLGTFNAGNAVTLGSDAANNLITLGSSNGDTLTVNSIIQGTNALVFEGSGADANETTFAITNPSADRTITFPNATGTVCLQSAAACGFIASSLTDNVADALDIQEGTRNYININTTNAAEGISFGNATTNPYFDFDGTGTTTFGGSVQVVGASLAAGLVNTPNLLVLDSNITHATGLSNDTLAVFSNANTGLSNAGISVLAGNIGYSYLALGDTDDEDVGYVSYYHNTNTLSLGTNATTQLTISSAGLVTLTGDIAVNGDDITSDSNLTIAATGYVRIGDSGTPGVATADDELYVLGDIETDGVLNVAGAATITGNLAVDTNTLYVDASTNRVGFGTSTLTQGSFVIDLPGVDTANGGIAGIAGTLSSTTNDLGAFGIGTVVSVGSSADRDFAGFFSQINTATNNLNTGTASLSGFGSEPTYTGTGTINNLIGYYAAVTNASSGTVANTRSFEVHNPINSGTITNNTGLYVFNQTAGATTDYGIYIEGSDTYALFVDAGASRLDGTLTVGGLATFDANLRISDGSSNYGTIAVQSTAGDYTYTIPTTTVNDTFCLVTLANCSGSASTLQASYTADADGSDAVVALTTADDSIIFRNPSSSGTDSGFVTSFDQLNTGAVDSVRINNAGTGNLLGLYDNGTLVASFADGGNLLANNVATGTTGTTTGTGTTTTTLTLTADAFAVNDVVLIDNAGQDYYTRITVDPGTGSYTVSPAVTFETGRTVTKYNIQNIGATASDYTTNSNKFFTGNFLGAVNVGAGTTTLSDGVLTSTNGLQLQSSTGITLNTTGNAPPTLFSNFNDVTFPPSGFTTGGSANWARDTSTAKEGAASANSGTQGNNTLGWLDYNYTAPTNGTLSFYWKVSSEVDWDYLMFCLDNDGCTLANDTEYDAISGTVDWTRVSVPVTAGARSFRWVFARDSTGSGGTNEGWVDNITFTPSAPSLSVTTTETSLSNSLYVGSYISLKDNGVVEIRGDGSYVPALVVKNQYGTDNFRFTPGDSGGDLQIGPDNRYFTFFQSETSSLNDDLQIAVNGLDGLYYYQFTDDGRFGINASESDNPRGALDVWTDDPAFYGAIITGAASQSASLLRLETNANTELLTVSGTGAANFRNSANSTTAFQIQNSGGTNELFSVDTTNSRVYVGDTTADTTGTLLILDTKNNAGDPTGVAGGMYYNSSTGKIRCYEGGIWKNCVATSLGVTTTVTRIPEFEGGTIYADGTSNSGTLTSGYASGLSGAEGYKHNYYQWSTSQATAQDYNIVVQVPIPSDFTGSFSSISFWHSDPDGATTNAEITLTITDQDGTSCSSATYNGASAGVWEQETVSVSTCTYSPDDILTFDFRIKTTSGAGNLRLGEFKYQYVN